MTLKSTLRLGSQQKITWTPVKVSFSEPPKRNVNIELKGGLSHLEQYRSFK